MVMILIGYRENCCAGCVLLACWCVVLLMRQGWLALTYHVKIKKKNEN